MVLLRKIEQAKVGLRHLTMTIFAPRAPMKILFLEASLDGGALTHSDPSTFKRLNGDRHMKKSPIALLPLGPWFAWKS